MLSMKLGLWSRDIGRVCVVICLGAINERVMLVGEWACDFFLGASDIAQKTPHNTSFARLRAIPPEVLNAAFFSVIGVANVVGRLGTNDSGSSDGHQVTWPSNDADPGVWLSVG